MFYFIAKYLLFPFVWLLYRPKIYGKELMRVKGKAIFVCNHLSMWDPLMLAVLSPRYIHFMAKAELFRTIWGKLLFYGLLAFPVNRKQTDRTSIRRAMQVLDKGKVFGIFPEGKRSITGSLDEFEKGAAFLAVRSGAPVLPLYISPQSYVRRQLCIFVGTPIDVESIKETLPKSEQIEAVYDRIGHAIVALKERCEEVEYANPRGKA